MAYRQKLSQGTRTSIPGGIPTVGKVLSLIKQTINHEQFDFYELETFEVTKVLLDYEDLPKQKDGQPNYSYYGSVAGRFTVKNSQSIKPEDGPQLVRPLDPRIKNYPVVGELVIVANYGGKSYYWNTLNNFNLVNENSVPGISYIGTGEVPPTVRTKFGKRFERNASIRQVKADEGDLILHGRFGNSINLGSNDNNSLIKIRSGQRTDLDTGGGPIPEDINEDKNSIYLSTSGRHEITNTNTDYKPLIGNDNCIIVNSDNLIFNGRNGNVDIRSSKSLHLEGKDVKLGDKKAEQSVIRGEDLKKFLDAILTELNAFATSLSGTPITGQAAKLVVSIGVLKTKLANSPMYSEKVKTV